MKSNQQSNSEKEIQEKEKEADRLRTIVNSLRTDVDALIISEHELENLKRKVKEAEGKLNSQAHVPHDETKLSLMEAEVNGLESERQKKRETVKRLHAKIEKFVLIQQRAKDLGELQQSIDRKLEVERVKIVAVLKAMPALTDLGNCISRSVDQCSKKEQECSKNLQELKGRVVASSVQLARMQSELDEVDKNLKAEQKVMNLYQSKQIVKEVRGNKLSWKSAIENLDKELKEEIRLNLASENMADLFENYCKTAESKKGCPLCERPFQTV